MKMRILKSYLYMLSDMGVGGKSSGNRFASSISKFFHKLIDLH